MQSVGTPLNRTDGRGKVTGKALYTADLVQQGVTHAVLVTSHSAPGRIRELDVSEAENSPGVLAVVTHLNAFKDHKPEPVLEPAVPGYILPDNFQVLRDDQIWFAGQPVAVIVADTLEHAQAATTRVRLELEGRTPRVDGQAGVTYTPDTVLGDPPDISRGSFEQGWQEAEARVDSTYRVPSEHHNPIELYATIATWEGNRLTLHDTTRWLEGSVKILSAAFGLPQENVHVLSPFIGGAFGSKAFSWVHAICAALAAWHAKRPAKLVLTREQMFHIPGFRPFCDQRMRLGARRDGRLTAIAHDGRNQTSSTGQFTPPLEMTTRMLYACPNVRTTHRAVRTDTQTPTWMRAPAEAPGTFALESAMDELAYELRMDPVELRIRNYAEKDQEQNLPWSSNELLTCYKQGQTRFGWDLRDPRPRSMTDGHSLVGWGMATATYPTVRSPASARIRIPQEGPVVIQSATHEIGSGISTVMVQIAADALGVEPGEVNFEFGDSTFPQAPVTGASQSTASVGTAVQAAVASALQRLRDLARTDPASPLHGVDPGQIEARQGRLILPNGRGEDFREIVRRNGPVEVVGHATPGEPMARGEIGNQWSTHAFGAQFAEVRVDADLGVVRVTRWVGAFAVGRVLNPKTARSQLLGGIIMGIGLALGEEGIRDRRWGRVVNSSFEGYLVPVNSDIPEIDAFLVPEQDPHVNELGVKGLGELGISGAGAAIANAVFHAIGKRVRDLPIRVEQLL